MGPAAKSTQFIRGTRPRRKFISPTGSTTFGAVSKAGPWMLIRRSEDDSREFRKTAFFASESEWKVFRVKISKARVGVIISSMLVLSLHKL